MERKKSFVDLVEETREDIEKMREFFQERFPLAWNAILELCVDKLPEDRLEKLLRESSITLVDAPKVVIGSGQRGVESIFSLMKKKLQESVKPEEIESQTLALIKLTEEPILLLVEGFKAIGMMRKSIQETRQEQGI